MKRTNETVQLQFQQDVQSNRTHALSQTMLIWCESVRDTYLLIGAATVSPYARCARRLIARKSVYPLKGH